MRTEIPVAPEAREEWYKLDKELRRRIASTMTHTTFAPDQLAMGVKIPYLARLPVLTGGDKPKGGRVSYGFAEFTVWPIADNEPTPGAWGMFVLTKVTPPNET